jgi:hypothetical protein
MNNVAAALRPPGWASIHDAELRLHVAPAPRTKRQGPGMTLPAIERELGRYGALDWAHALCARYGYLLKEVLGPGRHHERVLVRHELWVVFCDTFGVSPVSAERIFGVEHSTLHKATLLYHARAIERLELQGVQP